MKGRTVMPSLSEILHKRPSSPEAITPSIELGGGTNNQANVLMEKHTMSRDIPEERRCHDQQAADVVVTNHHLSPSQANHEMCSRSAALLALPGIDSFRSRPTSAPAMSSTTTSMTPPAAHASTQHYNSPPPHVHPHHQYLKSSFIPPPHVHHHQQTTPSHHQVTTNHQHPSYYLVSSSQQSYLATTGSAGLWDNGLQTAPNQSSTTMQGSFVSTQQQQYPEHYSPQPPHKTSPPHHLEQQHGTTMYVPPPHHFSPPIASPGPQTMQSDVMIQGTNPRGMYGRTCPSDLSKQHDKGSIVIISESGVAQNDEEDGMVLSPEGVPMGGRQGKFRRGWTRDEHIRFLLGVYLYGRGNWKNISKVIEGKSPKQVQSHAQKYFLRQEQAAKTKRSIHDFNFSDLMVLIKDNDFKDSIQDQQDLVDLIARFEQTYQEANGNKGDVCGNNYPIASITNGSSGKLIHPTPVKQLPKKPY